MQALAFRLRFDESFTDGIMSEADQGSVPGRPLFSLVARTVKNSDAPGKRPIRARKIWNLPHRASYPSTVPRSDRMFPDKKLNNLSLNRWLNTDFQTILRKWTNPSQLFVVDPFVPGGNRPKSSDQQNRNSPSSWHPLRKRRKPTKSTGWGFFATTSANPCPQ